MLPHHPRKFSRSQQDRRALSGGADSPPRRKGTSFMIAVAKAKLPKGKKGFIVRVIEGGSIREVEVRHERPHPRSSCYVRSAFIKYFQHRGVFRKDLRNQFFEPGVAGKRSEMAHQCSADTLSLVFVDHSECHLGCPGAHDDITAAANDCTAATISHHCHQGDMAGEIDIQKEVNFLFGKIAS